MSNLSKLYDELIQGLVITKSNYYGITTYLVKPSDKQGLRIKAWDGSTLGAGVTLDYREDISLYENHKRALQGYLKATWSLEGLKDIKEITLVKHRVSTRIHKEEYVWSIVTNS